MSVIHTDRIHACGLMVGDAVVTVAKITAVKACGNSHIEVSLDDGTTLTYYINDSVTIKTALDRG
jgi:hypothetical protein